MIFSHYCFDRHNEKIDQNKLILQTIYDRFMIIVSMKSLLLILPLLLTLASPKLIYLTQLFRHGARYPTSDFYDGKQTKAFHGKLTSVGMRQQYLLGSYLKRDYIDKEQLFSGTLLPREVEIFTDSTERCYQSAYGHAAGLFQIGNGQRIPSGISNDLLRPPFETSALLTSEEQPSRAGDFALSQGYQPVPIKHEEVYFPSCPNQALLIAKRVQAIAVQAAQLELEHAVFSEKMGKLFGLSPALGNIAGMVELYDVVVCDLNLGRAMPAQFTQRDLGEMRYIQNYMFVLLYAEELARVASTPIAASIVAKMEQVIAGRYDSKKLTIYSGHDTNVAPMLTFMNLSSADCLRRKWRNETVSGNCGEPVPFASSVQFQLHQRESSQGLSASSYFVKIKYNGDYYLVCDSKAYQCDFQEFSTRVKRQLADYNKQCGTK